MEILKLSLCGLLVFSTTLISGEIVLPEGSQIALESIESLLPDARLSSKIGQEIQNIRNAYKRNVSHIIHEPQWAPGELLAIKITDGQINRLRRSRYGLIDVKKFDWGGAHLYFSHPYNPNNLKTLMEAEFGFQSNNNEYWHRTKKISYNAYRGSYRFEYGWGDCARGWPCLYTQYWEFQQGTDGYIRLVKEGGEPAPEEISGGASDVPIKIDPYPYAPNKKYRHNYP